MRSPRDFDAVQIRIAALEVLVKIGEDNAATRKATAEYAKQIATLESKVEQEQKRFSENSAYTVSISFNQKKAIATGLQGRLTALGFRAFAQELPLLGRGNVLTYTEEGEAKAQEVLTLIKPIVKDVQAKKTPPL